MRIELEVVPTVSIIMCTFNRANLISDSIVSCLNQTLESWELIIVDDYSTDETAQVVGLFKDQRIKFIENPSHIGRSNARNIGLDISKGKYISFLDSDDLIDSKKLENDVRLLKLHNEKAVVYSSASSVDVLTGKILGQYLAAKSGDLYDDVAFYLPLVIATSQVTVTRDLLRVVGGFDGELDRFEDTDFFRRISRETSWIAEPANMVTLKNHSDNILSNQSQNTIVRMIDLYVSKAEREIVVNSISTSASPERLYLHYAQALFSQQNGILTAIKLYLELLKKHPKSFGQIMVSILKMSRFKAVFYIRKINLTKNIQLKKRA